MKVNLLAAASSTVLALFFIALAVWRGQPLYLLGVALAAAAWWSNFRLYRRRATRRRASS
jgi:4-hydroxybenzoate polyprenyltransferase